ncbi:FAD:protein FMN transferase [Roseibium sp. Sym1]|uniref:FAD:protein FMN transferase n=1 Tax=Roseibium sp. Sym1 TaxID=3016006 RepID=UPI0022B4CB9D|nr:FAD:protein FMN transferase [Roseibium sp. Sym1]
MHIELAAATPVSTSLPDRHVVNGATMGTRYGVVFYSDLPVEQAALRADLQAAVDRVDLQMSPWQRDSILCRFNREPPGTWVDLPDETYEVVHAALRICVESDGAFDPFVGELVAAWGFGPDRQTVDTAMAARLKETWQHQRREVELDRNGRRLRRLSEGQLDLCGIAKGYGADCLSRVMSRWGLCDHLVSIDGELRASGCKPGGAPWSVALERPERDVRSEAFTLALASAGVATSGNYRKVRNASGTMVSHTMHPQHGVPVDNGLLSVSVLSGSCMEADAWATALMVMGPDQGLAKARDCGLDAIFLNRKPSGGIAMSASRPELLPESMR